MSLKISNVEKFRILEMHKKAIKENLLTEDSPTPSGSEDTLARIKLNPSSDLEGQTVNLYHDEAMKLFDLQYKIKRISKTSNGVQLRLVGKDDDAGTLRRDYEFNCKDPKGLTNRFTTYYNNELVKVLKDKYCSVGQGGTNVPKADFASNQPTEKGV